MGAAAVARLLVAAALVLNSVLVRAFPERGKYDKQSDLTNLTGKLTDCSGHEDGRIRYGFEKTMFAGTTVTAHVSCAPDSPANISVVMYLIHSSCYTEQFVDCLLDVVKPPAAPVAAAHKSSRGTESQEDGKKGKDQSAGTAAGSSNTAGSDATSKDLAAAKTAAKTGVPAEPPRLCSCRSSDAGNGKTAAALPEPTLRASTSVALSCTKAVASEPQASGESHKRSKVEPVNDAETAAAAQPNGDEAASKKKLMVGEKGADEAKTNDGKGSPSMTHAAANENSPAGSAILNATTPVDGVYYVLLWAVSRDSGEDDSRMNFTVDSAEARSSYGYLSAVDWPNYYFYMIMVIVYIIFQIAWFVMLACNWRDLLRVQYYIGAVILLGMIEKAVLFAEYENINKSGVSIKGAVIFAQIVSSLKRALSRVLIIIVCLGYGIVKPRLGPTLQKVLAAGIVYFLVASVEGCIRMQRDDYDSNSDLVAAVVLVVVEVGICWWIFTSLVQTYRTLRLRRNVVKLSLYRHFANALIFSVLASLAFIGWFLYAVRFSACISDFRELWLEEGFWQMLFTLLLLIVIILWRPSANNQRYAFAPLLDAGEEGDDDENYTVVMGETFTGTKLRTPGSDNQKRAKDKEYRAEDDLKWIEENIPTTALADKVLTVDSDEERVTARNEISKMD